MNAHLSLNGSYNANFPVVCVVSCEYKYDVYINVQFNTYTDKKFD